MCVTANVFLLFAPNFRRLLRNREFLLLLYIIWNTMKCIYACVNTFNWTFIGLKKVNRFTFRLNKLSVWLWGNICTKCIGNTAIINTFGLDKLLYIHSFKKIQQGCSWERQQRKSGAERRRRRGWGRGWERRVLMVRVEGWGSIPSVARLWRVPNAWIARQCSSILQDSHQRKKNKFSNLWV